jgi:hypothetical protein
VVTAVGQAVAIVAGLARTTVSIPTRIDPGAGRLRLEPRAQIGSETNTLPEMTSLRRV